MKKTIGALLEGRSKKELEAVYYFITVVLGVLK